jgi:hypothetical protein
MRARVQQQGIIPARRTEKRGHAETEALEKAGASGTIVAFHRTGAF